jgi:hypothetical protein
MAVKDLKKGTMLSIGTSSDSKRIANEKIRDIARFRIQ